MTDLDSFAQNYAHKLLANVSASQQDFINSQTLDHPAISWCRSGAMALTGFPNQPGLMSPAPLTGCADGALLAYKSLLMQVNGVLAPELSALVGATLLTERARLAGLSRQGQQAVGGACRLLASKNGCLSVNLPRDDDWPLAQAWLETPLSDWSAVAAAVRTQSSKYLLERAQLLGLAVSNVAPIPARVLAEDVFAAPSVITRKNTAPLVLDLSALWAGPLAASLLGLGGARVIKVESEQRLDGARGGDKTFYDLLNQNKESIRLDLKSSAGIKVLKKLIAQADIVIESARPRGLQQLGIDAQAYVADNPSLVWLSITAYGRELPNGNWVGFGDDVGVAAGLSAQLNAVYGDYVFSADAVADPITGIHAALAAYANYLSGKGGVLDVSMHAVTTMCAAIAGDVDLSQRCERWTALANEGVQDLYPIRTAGQPAQESGADTQAVVKALARGVC